MDSIETIDKSSLIQEPSRRFAKLLCTYTTGIYVECIQDETCLSDASIGHAVVFSNRLLVCQQRYGTLRAQQIVQWHFEKRVTVIEQSV